MSKTKVLLAIGVGLTLICCGSIWYYWYFPNDPVSPPPIKLGENSEFDDILSKTNTDWAFLFQQNNSIIETDIYGENTKVILDIKEITQNENSELVSVASISPNGNYLALNYIDSKERTEWSSLGKLVIFNLNSGECIYIVPEMEDYTHDWSSPIYWLNDHMIIVRVHRYRPNSSENITFSEEIVIIKYDLQDLSQIDTYKLGRGGHQFLQYPYTNVLLLRWGHVITNEQNVFVIDSAGKRLSTKEEFEYFTYNETECYLNTQNCLVHFDNEFPNVNIERVAFCYDCFRRYKRDNQYRYFIYLENELVVVTDNYLNNEPVWDPDLRLYIWEEGEGDDAYFMDEYGHYRYWFNGDYLGKYQKSFDTSN